MFTADELRKKYVPETDVVRIHQIINDGIQNMAQQGYGHVYITIKPDQADIVLPQTIPLTVELEKINDKDLQNLQRITDQKEFDQLRMKYDVSQYYKSLGYTVRYFFDYRQQGSVWALAFRYHMVW
jgi:DnaJ-class molecular chaperone